MRQRLRLVLLYKDGVRNEVIVQTSPDIAAAIQRKGLLAAEIYVDEFIQSFPGQSSVGLPIDDFKTGKGG